MIASFLLMALLLPLEAVAHGEGASAPPGILQNVPERLESGFGPAIQIRSSQGKAAEQQLLFAPAPWRRLWPDLPEEAEFGITVGPEGQVRAVWLDVNAMVREARTGVSRGFRFGKAEASAFFRRIFGRNPGRWRELQLPQGGGGHEGFLDRRICIDPGLALGFITYRLGEEWIRLVEDRRCP